MTTGTIVLVVTICVIFGLGILVGNRYFKAPESDALSALEGLHESNPASKLIAPKGSLSEFISSLEKLDSVESENWKKRFSINLDKNPEIKLFQKSIVWQFRLAEGKNELSGEMQDPEAKQKRLYEENIIHPEWALVASLGLLSNSVAEDSQDILAFKYFILRHAKVMLKECNKKYNQEEAGQLNPIQEQCHNTGISLAKTFLQAKPIQDNLGTNQKNLETLPPEERERRMIAMQDAADHNLQYRFPSLALSLILDVVDKEKGWEITEQAITHQGHPWIKNSLASQFIAKYPEEKDALRESLMKWSTGQLK